MKKFLSFLFLIIISANCFAGDNGLYLNSQPDNNFISCSKNLVFVSYLDMFKDNRIVKRYISINSVKNKNYFISNPNYCPVILKDKVLDIVNFRYDFLEIKENVIPYINKYFFQKIIFILSKVGFRPRITDAFRTSENQQRYKRRRWSSVDISPHIIGVAIDMVDHSGPDREIIKKLSEKLGVKFLFHGGGANRHIHLQEEKIWGSLNNLDIAGTSDSLSTLIKKQIDLKDVEISDSIKTNGDLILNYHYKSENYGRISFVIENVIGEKVAEINSGIFEPGEFDMKLRYDFLKKGFYKINIYENGRFCGQIHFVRY